MTAYASESEDEEDDKSPSADLGVRLSSSIRPIHYVVKLQPILSGNFTVFGSLEVEVEALEGTQKFVFHMADIVTKNETVKVLAKDVARTQPIAQQSYDVSNQFYTIKMKRKLRPGKNYVISLDFVGILGDKARGFYRSSYLDSDGKKRWVATSQFQATDARRAFPCFDEPSFKATFEVFIAREKHMAAISNMPLISTSPIVGQPNWVWDRFGKSVPMSTYVVAFAVLDFPNRDVIGNHGSTKIKIWTRKSVLENTDFSSQMASATLRFFEEYFDIKFPLPKLDLIAPPELSANAMENWGLITFRESALVYDSKVSSAEHRKYVCYLMAHELAHQWFGNLVTLKWWTDLWLNEGFATFMADLAIDTVEPSWGILDQFVVNRQQDVMGMDALLSSRPISIPVKDPSEISEIFDKISYSKGASLIRMMKHFLTDQTFKKGIQNYLSALKFKNAEQDDLWDFLTKAGHEDATLDQSLNVKTIMETWTLQGGFPVVTTFRNSGGNVTLTQTRFLLNTAHLTETDSQKWWIPISVITENGTNMADTRVKIWLSESNINLDNLVPPNEWFLINVKQAGFYRVNYDVTNWHLLATQLESNHEAIGVTNRAQIIDDSLNLARAGLLQYDTALRVISYLKKEKNLVPWTAAFNNLEYIFQMLRHTSVFGGFRAFLLSMITPLYETVGFEDRSTDELPTQLLRAQVLRWTCLLEHETCVSKSLALFRKWMADPKYFKGISYNVAPAVYCSAIRHGNEDEWSFAWQQYLVTENPTQKNALMEAMSCSRDVWLLFRYLEGGFRKTSGIRRQDAAGVFIAVSRTGLGSFLAWDFLRDQWNHIVEYIGSSYFALPAMVKAASNHFNSAQRLDELVIFQDDYEGQLGSATRAILQAVESTELNVQWMSTNYHLILQWLKERGFNSILTNG